jgi:hypothetical protein
MRKKLLQATLVTLSTAYLTLYASFDALSTVRIGRFLGGFFVGLLWMAVVAGWFEWFEHKQFAEFSAFAVTLRPFFGRAAFRRKV